MKLGFDEDSYDQCVRITQQNATVKTWKPYTPINRTKAFLTTTDKGVEGSLRERLDELKVEYRKVYFDENNMEAYDYKKSLERFVVKFSAMAEELLELVGKEPEKVMDPDLEALDMTDWGVETVSESDVKPKPDYDNMLIGRK